MFKKSQTSEVYKKSYSLGKATYRKMLGANRLFQNFHEHTERTLFEVSLDFVLYALSKNHFSGILSCHMNECPFTENVLLWFINLIEHNLTSYIWRRILSCCNSIKASLEVKNKFVHQAIKTYKSANILAYIAQNSEVFKNKIYNFNTA